MRWIRFGISAASWMVAVACASSGNAPARRATHFSPSAPLRVLFFDFRGQGVADSDLLHAGDLFLDSLVEARQAEVINARNLPESRDETAAAAFEGDRTPAKLGARAGSMGADYAVTGEIVRSARGSFFFAIEAVDVHGDIADGAGGKVPGEVTSVESAVQSAGGAILRAMPRPDGPATASDAARAMSARSGLLDRCYALGLMRSPSLVGRGIITVTLGATPEPVDVKVSSSFNDAAFESCLVSAVKTIRFPVLVGETTLNFPVAYVE
jgi:hypothetical protein